jgi:hypothetical protein
MSAPRNARSVVRALFLSLRRRRVAAQAKRAAGQARDILQQTVQEVEGTLARRKRRRGASAEEHDPEWTVREWIRSLDAQALSHLQSVTHSVHPLLTDAHGRWGVPSSH